MTTGVTVKSPEVWFHEPKLTHEEYEAWRLEGEDGEGLDVEGIALTEDPWSEFIDCLPGSSPRVELDPYYCWHYRGGNRMCLRLADHEGPHSYHKVSPDRLPVPEPSLPKASRRLFSVSQKKEMVELVRDGRTLTLVARRYGVSPSTLRSWMKSFLLG